MCIKKKNYNAFSGFMKNGVLQELSKAGSVGATRGDMTSPEKLVKDAREVS
jgi:hypothetical protein